MSIKRRTNATYGDDDRNTSAADMTSDGQRPSGGSGLSRSSHLGQNDEPDASSRSLVGGLSDDQLWLLLRRFDKVWHPTTFMAMAHGPQGGLYTPSNIRAKA